MLDRRLLTEDCQTREYFGVQLDILIWLMNAAGTTQATEEVGEHTPLISIKDEDEGRGFASLDHARSSSATRQQLLGAPIW